MEYCDSSCKHSILIMCQVHGEEAVSLKCQRGEGFVIVLLSCGHLSITATPDREVVS